MLSRNAFRRATRWLTLFAVVFTVLLSTVGVTSAVASAPSHTLAMGTETVAGQETSYLPAFRPISPDEGNATAPVCSSSGSSDGSTSSDLLAVNRWAPVTSNLHSRLDADAWGDISNKVQRNQVDSTMLSVGNTMWQASTSLVELSNNFCIADGIGYTIDNKAGELAKTLWGDGSAGGVTIVLLLLIGAIAMAVMRARQSPGQFGRAVIKPVMVLALFAVMMNGALSTVPGKFGTMSPGWMVNAASNVVSGVSGAVAAPIADNAYANSFATQNARDSASQNDASCINYLSAMRSQYEKSFGGSSASLRSSAAVPLAMDSMWQLSGLSSYVRAQYGTDNNYGWASFCRGLEVNAGSSLVDDAKTGVSVPELLAAQGMNVPSSVTTSWAFAPADGTTWDEMAVFWAACQTGDGGKSWSVAPGWETVSNSHTDAKTLDAKQCLDFFNGTGSKDDMFFNWQDDASAVQTGTKDVSSAAISSGNNPRDFLNVLHGTSTGSASTAAMLYAMFSVINLFIFGVMAGMIFVLKTLLLAFGLFVFFVLLVDVLPIHRESQTLRYFKTTLGFVVVAFGYSLALSVMILLTSFILSIGNAMGLSGFFDVLWVSAAPIIAIVAMKLIWKKIAKAPDPFSVRGAKGYMSSAASGMIGGAAAEGVSGLFQRGKEAIPGMGRNPNAGGVMGGAGSGSTVAGGTTNPQGASARSGGADPLARETDGNAAGGSSSGGVDPEVAERAGAAGYELDSNGRPVAGTGDGSLDDELAAGAGVASGVGASSAYDHSSVERRYDPKAQRKSRREGAAQRRQWYGGRDEVAGGAKAKVANELAARRQRAIQALRSNPVKSTLHSRGAWTAVGAAGLAAGAVTAMPAAFAVAGAAGLVAAGSTLSRRGRAHRQSRKLLDNREKNAFFDSMNRQASERNKEATRRAEEATQQRQQQAAGGKPNNETSGGQSQGESDSPGGQQTQHGGVDHETDKRALAEDRGVGGMNPAETASGQIPAGADAQSGPPRDGALPNADDGGDDQVPATVGAPPEYLDERGGDTYTPDPAVPQPNSAPSTGGGPAKSEPVGVKPGAQHAPSRPGETLSPSAEPSQSAPEAPRDTSVAPAPPTRAARRESKRWFGGDRPAAPPRDGGGQVPPTNGA
ncbi:hypothetical protein ATK17_1729 [Branchiibius hedensis]|uniref:TrbL/VirB6 plasmid conjugal transfer protein n=1 Tax=Branchiibius hedensis TaxID=672460 RepID=A0A2Y8ZPZ8_9MICO|nr:hypothetical protein [Branchiibius hedensis]PWJ25597.1 hypothetical protein ATK17_1729 [Branchiibius hedensis]SSA34410.1 hypothetical protein SAMN04489750_1729 [Branchiibius hedensis]